MYIMVKISKQHLRKGHHKRLGIKTKKTHITVHSTANTKSTAQNERDWLDNKKNKSNTSYHYVVGEDKIIEVLPPEEKAYHAGDGKYGPGNTHSIGIEMVESGNRQKVLNNTMDLIAKLQKDFSIPHKNVVRHYDWSRKNCPRILNTDGKWTKWWIFKNDLLKRQEKKKSRPTEDVINVKRVNQGVKAKVKIEYDSKGNRRQYVSFDTLRELGFNIGWDSKTQTVIINDK